MREIDTDPRYERMIDDCLDSLVHQFIHEEKEALLETADSSGNFVDTPEGRVVNPGHSMETAWFIMREAIYRKDRTLMERAIQVTEWSLRRGWDKEQGGIFYFVDVDNKPVLSLEWDMKLFWVQCEAMIALVYSYWFTENEEYLKGFEVICDYVYQHFADPGYPEWYGHLHRDGTPISPIKGSDWKGPFHNVRAFMLLTQLFKELEEGKTLDF
ncbi:MAG: hypothetical protein HFF17_16390 [Oscillospiraceae bacterium]|nr:hypothetical protein [Oscillospiraceae bacterium]